MAFLATLLRWLQIPEFRAEYLKASQAMARLQQSTSAAAVTVLKLMTDPNVPASVKLRAAEAILSVGRFFFTRTAWAQEPILSAVNICAWQQT